MADKIRTVAPNERMLGRRYIEVPGTGRYAEIVETNIGSELVIDGLKFMPVKDSVSKAGDVDSAIVGGNLLTLALTIGAMQQTAATGSYVGLISGFLSSSTLTVVSPARAISISGTTLVKGARTPRPGYHQLVVREAYNSKTKDSSATFKVPRTSKVLEDFEKISSGLTSSDATKVTADKSWSVSGLQSLNIAQPAGAASQTITATKTFVSVATFSLDDVFAIDLNNKGSVSPSNIAIRLIGASGPGPQVSLPAIQDLRAGVQSVSWCGKHMVADGSRLPADFTTTLTGVEIAVTGPSGVSVSFDRFRRNAKGRARACVGADGGFADFTTFLLPAMTSRFGSEVTPYLALRADMTKQSNAQTPSLSVAQLQAAAAAGCQIINRAMSQVDLTTLSRADQAAQFKACSDYILGIGPRVIGSADAVGVGDGPTGKDISTRVLPSGRRCKSSAYQAAVPGGTANADTIQAARDANLANFSGGASGGLSDKDGLGSIWNLPRISMNVADAAPVITKLQAMVDTGQSFDLFANDFGRVDAGSVGLRSATGTTTAVANAILDWMAARVADGSLDVLTRLELYESLPQAPLALPGVNLAAAEFGGKGVDDALNSQYTWPTVDEVNYYGNRGVKLFRVPFRYHHLFNAADDTKRTADWTKLNAFLDACDARSIMVLMDMHQYGYKTVDGDPGNAGAYHTVDVFYQDTDADKTLFASRWRRLAAELKNRPNMRYGLMNEPTSYANAPNVEQLGRIFQAAINAIAAEDPAPDHLIHVCGWGYSSAIEWVSSGNGAMIASLVDPRGGKIVGEPHQYLDVDPRFPGTNSHPGKEANPVILDFADSAGSYVYNGSTYIFEPALKAATEHARVNGYKLFLGEFATTQDSVYMNEVRRELRYIHDNRGVWDGFAYWGAGPWWEAFNADGSIRKAFSPEPRDRTGVDKQHVPQMNLLSEFMDVGEADDAVIAPTASLAYLTLYTGATSNFLAAMGSTQSDLAAIGVKGLKELAPWAILGRALDEGRIDNGRGDNNFISSRALARDYTAWVGDNTDKPINELTEGVTDWSRDDKVVAELAQKAPDMLKNKAFHLVIGWESYLPAWLKTKLANMPAEHLNLVRARVEQIRARYGGDLSIHRVDIGNEITNESGNTVTVAEDFGYRLANNPWRVAALTSAGQTVSGGNSRAYLELAFKLFAGDPTANPPIPPIFPNAKLFLTDYNYEMVMSPDDYSPGVFNTPSVGNVYTTGNDTIANKYRMERAKEFLFAMSEQGLKNLGIGFQFHTSSYHPSHDTAFGMALQDFYRWGVEVAVTELNTDLNTPGHLGTSPSRDVIDRYNTVYSMHQLEILLQNSLCKEVTAWSPVTGSGAAAQPVTHQSKDYALRTGLALVLARAKAPADRKIKRGSRVDFKRRIPMWVELTGVQSLSGNRVAQTQAGHVRMKWRWYNAPWMPFPISGAEAIYGAQFVLNSSSFAAAGQPIVGEDNADGSTSLLCIGKGTDIYIRQKVAGTTQADIKVPNMPAMSQAQTSKHRIFMKRSADGMSVKVAMGVRVAAGTVTMSTIQTVALAVQQPEKTDGYVYTMTQRDGTVVNANIGASFLEVHHGPDFPTDAELVELARPDPLIAWVANVAGVLYAGD